MHINRSNGIGMHRLLLATAGTILLASGSAFAQAPPANDDCANAAVIDPAAPFPPYTNTVDATGATFDGSDPLLSCNSNGGGDGNQTVWYQYTPDASGWVDFNTFDSVEAGGGELDTAHGIYTGNCGALVEVACVDQTLTDTLNFEVQAGTTYYVKVGQFADQSDAGSVVMNVDEGEEPPPPLLPARLIIESSNNGTSIPVRDIVAGLAPATLEAARNGNALDVLVEVPNFMKADGQSSKSDADVNGSQVAGTGRAKWRGPAELLQVFEGGENDDNWSVLGTLIAPPDTVGDIGKEHYVQMFNLLTEIFDKDGNSVLGPFPTSTFFAGMDGNCAISDDGDPIVLYDEETDRWLVSQFLASFQDGICIAISETGDPTGSYHQYEFDFTGIGFPDYPKFGFATGAVNVMVNLFTPFQGSALGAIDKSELLSGDPATMVLFTGGDQAALAFGWVPGDNDGPVFDNTLPTFFTNLGGSGSTIFVAELTPDWSAPENTGLSFTGISVSPWDSFLCNGPRGACIDQPGSGTTVGAAPGVPEGLQGIAYLEGITDRMMLRGQTRDFGKRKQAILTHTVDADGTGKAGLRWYELRNDKDRGWTLKKENTFSPDGDHRWMASIAMTASGTTCLGYSISSETRYPSIGIAGRKGTSNHMNIRELVAFDGNAAGNVQRLTARWGDYSSMSVDPVDDSCWYTTEYASPNSSIWPTFGVPFGEVFGWGTKIIQFDAN
jgi:hypothetical protein